MPSLHSQFQDQPIVERLVLWPSIKTQLCLTFLWCYGDTHCSEQYTLHFRNTNQLVFSINVVNYIDNAYASIQAFSFTPIRFYQFLVITPSILCGAALAGLSVHSQYPQHTNMHKAHSKATSRENMPRQSQNQVSWFRILPDCLDLSLLEKELQVSYRETPDFSALWKENLISKYTKNISLDNTLSYLRGILILTIKQCKGVSPVESHIPKHGIWLTIWKTRAFQNLSDLLRCLWTRSFSVTEDARAWKQYCGHISESITSQTSIPGQLTQGQSSLYCHFFFFFFTDSSLRCTTHTTAFCPVLKPPLSHKDHCTLQSRGLVHFSAPRS